MPKKLLKKLLPSHESIKSNRYIGVFGKALHHPNLWHLHKHSVSGGVAVGMFCGLIPGPFQMIGAALLSIVFKVNLPVAVFTTLYTNPFTIIPLYIAAYEIGEFVTGEQVHHIPISEFDLGDKAFAEWLPALVEYLELLGKPLMVGLPILALSLAVAGYLIVRGAWRLRVMQKWNRRCRERLERDR